MSLECVAPMSHPFFDQICMDGIQLVPMYFIIIYIKATCKVVLGMCMMVRDILNVPQMCSSYVTPLI